MIHNFLQRARWNKNHRQSRQTYHNISDTTQNAHRPKQISNQIKTKSTNQAPIQTTNNSQNQSQVSPKCIHDDFLFKKFALFTTLI